MAPAWGPGGTMAQWASLPLGLATEQAEHQQTKLGTGDRGPRACGGSRGSGEGLCACRWTRGHGPRAYVQGAATRGGRVLVCHNHMGHARVICEPAPWWGNQGGGGNSPERLRVQEPHLQAQLASWTWGCADFGGATNVGMHMSVQSDSVRVVTSEHQL